MRALVTGGNGLIGASIVSQLMEKGYHVAIFDLKFDTLGLSRAEKEKVQFIQGDLANFASVMGAIKDSNPDVIYHSGSMLSIPSEANPQAAFYANCVGTFHVLEGARLLNVPEVVFASTMSSYGEGIENGIGNDNATQRPGTLYGALKVGSELLGRYYRKKYNLDFRCLRFAAIVGPGAMVKHISVYNAWMIEKSYYGEPFEIFVSPEITMSLTYYKDAAAGMIRLAEAPKENIKTVCYNTLGDRITAQALKDAVERQLPQAKLSFNPDPAIDAIHNARKGVTFDDSNARKEWNWHQLYNTEAIIEDFCKELKIRDARKNGEDV